MTILRGIGLTGAAGTGKTTFARAVQKEFLTDGHLAVVISFATVLKLEVVHEFQLPNEIINPNFDKTSTVSFAPPSAHKCLSLYGKVPVTVRELFQLHGTYRRSQDPSYWLKQVSRTVSGFLISNKDQFGEVCVIFDDVRYPNEVDYIRLNFGAGAKILKLERKTEYEVNPHESENQELKFDLILDLDKDKVGLLPIAVRCDHYAGEAVGAMTRAPRS